MKIDAVTEPRADGELKLLLTPEGRIAGSVGDLSGAAPDLLPISGELLTAYLHADDGPSFLAALAEIASGSPAEAVLRLRVGDLWWPVLIRLSRAGLESAASVIPLREGVPVPDAEHLSEILDKSLNAVLVHRKGRILYANRTYARLHGYSSVADAVANHVVGQTIHPEDRRMVGIRMAARLRGEDVPAQYEFRLLREDGSVIWVECLASRINWTGGPALLAIYHDATARKRAEEALRRSERLFSSIFLNSPDAMVLSTLAEGRLLDVNEAFLRARGFRRQDVIGRTGLELGLWESAKVREEIVHRLRRDGRITDEPLRFRSPAGEMLEILACAELLRTDDEELVLYRLTDVTERRRAAARIMHMAHHDPLTGVANRILFHDRLEEALKKRRPVAVLSVDLDRFKEVNDSFGHKMGDALLSQVAGRLGAGIRDCDTVARLGGDEFAVIQAGGKQPGAARALAQAIVTRLAEPFEIRDRTLLIGASIGIAISPRDGREPSKLLQAADLALSRAKGAGRGGIWEFRPEMAREEEMRGQLEQELRQAVAAHQFDLHFQPLMDLRNRRPSGCEALLRWNHPQRGPVRPDHFIRLAEDTGLIMPLGRWVIERACAEAARWPSECKVAVNISPEQLRRRGLIDDVRAALETSGLPPHRLELELTESVVLQDTDEALSTLRQLKEMGVSLALDDFGTGYSSLSALVRFPFDRVKIDRSFVAGIGQRSDCTAVVRAVTGLCASLGLATTAEGVETEEQLHLLLCEGLKEGQGYLFSPARSAADICGVLAAAN